jgi:hypothetical protein
LYEEDDLVRTKAQCVVSSGFDEGALTMGLLVCAGAGRSGGGDAAAGTGGRRLDAAHRLGGGHAARAAERWGLLLAVA